MVVINSDERSELDLDTISIDQDNAIFNSLRNSMLSSKWVGEQLVSDFDFCGNLDEMTAFSAPMHTPHGRHFGFCVLSKTDKMQNYAIETIKHSLDLVFDRFFQKIILPVTLPVISSRELEVIRWSSEGKTSVEIAIILGLSEHTINSYTTKILQKLHVVNRAQMVAKAIRMGLIQ
jgi:DNA-binding CsgD family transcriptional regulator